MMTNFELEYKMIPAILDYALEAGNDDMLSAMVDKEFWKEFAGNAHKDGVLVNWDEFEVEGIDYSDDWVVIAFQFPEPVVSPEACFGAIFLHKAGKGTKYFTMEKSMGERWALCSPELGNHQLISIREERPTRPDFLALVADYYTKWVNK